MKGLGRQEKWTRLQTHKPWDLVVIGGGITGAGILREAARRGVRGALIEARDFAWGTSSRSSKMIHGGLRYLMAGQVGLARAALRERERLLREAPGLVREQGFVLAHYRRRWPPAVAFGGLLRIYDLLAGRWTHRRLSGQETRWLVPGLRCRDLQGATRYADAVTDDARLTLRVIREAEHDGALALNYAPAVDLLIHRGGVGGVAVRDQITGQTLEVEARWVVNATGVWCDDLRRRVGGGPRLRPLRGSHLVFPFWRLPVGQTVTLLHPVDRRPVFIMPWEGVTLVGNTDLDHGADPGEGVYVSSAEMDYLLEALRWQFPESDLGESDVQAVFAGIRPVIGGGRRPPSKERRDHHVWVEQGLVSVSGGKLTTFRRVARDALQRAGGTPADPRRERTYFCSPGARNLDGLSYGVRRRLAGRYGPDAGYVAKEGGRAGLSPVAGTDTLWAELCWAARAEDVVHLEDLLLRRTRLGILLPRGGRDLFPALAPLCREILGWSEERWRKEQTEYCRMWTICHGAPGCGRAPGP